MQKYGSGEFEFVLTGNLTDWNLPHSDAVTCTGMIDDLRPFLKTVRGVCLLSPLGHGFKTTIGDSIAHGCHVLVHPALARRCPRALAPAMIPVDSARASDVPRACERLSGALPCSRLDSELREINQRMLGTAFGLDLRAPQNGLLCH
jgi:hypothetical protein